MIDNDLPVMITDEAGMMLGFIKTNMSIQQIEEVIEESYKKDCYNYDVKELIKEIREKGWEAERVYLDTIEI